MRTGRKPDGCAICFKHSKFSLLSANPVEFYRPDVPLLDRDNVGLVLLLRPKVPRTTCPVVCVANTHLLYNPRRGDIKLAQLAMLLAEMASVATQQDGSFCPIVMCGDFNSVPGSPLYSFIKEGKLDYAGLAIGKVGAGSVPSTLPGASGALRAEPSAPGWGVSPAADPGGRRTETVACLPACTEGIADRTQVRA